MPTKKPKTIPKAKSSIVEAARLVAHAAKQNTAPNAELERERLISLINSMADGVIATDENTKIVMSNGAALNILDVNNSMESKQLEAVLKLVDKNNQPIDIRQTVLDTKTQFTNRDWFRLRPKRQTGLCYSPA